MRDLLRFILRGASFGVAFSLGLTIIFSSAMAAYFFERPIVLFYALLPGAVAGLALWFVAGKVNRPISAGLRFSIGTAAAAVFLSIAVVVQMAITLDAVRQQGLDISVLIMGVAINAVWLGGLGGLACPSAREYLYRGPDLTYRERARLYQAAEEEARAARERNASSRMVTHPPWNILRTR